MTRERVDSPDHLPVAALASCLNQHDVTLGGIDIVAHGSRAVTGTPAAEVYDNLVGPLPAVARRTVWVALRFDAAADGASVARRGGGEEGAARTVAVAARRVVRRSATPATPRASCRDRRGVGGRAHLSRRPPRRDGPAVVPCPAPGPVQHRQRDRTPASQPRTAHRGVGAPGVGTTVTVRLRPAADKDSVLVGAAFRTPPVRCRPEVCGTGPDLDAGPAPRRSRRSIAGLVPGSRPPHSPARNRPGPLDRLHCRWPVAGNSSVRTPRATPSPSGCPVQVCATYWSTASCTWRSRWCSGLWGPVRGCWSTPTDLMRGRHW